MAKVEGVLQQTATGVYAIGIAVTEAKVTSNALGTRYMVVSKDMTIPAEVNCDGVMRRPKMVLKVYVNVPANQARKQREQRLYDRLKRGLSPTPV